MTVKEHSPAPPFSLPDQNGDLHSIDVHKGKWIVLYFYPKDDTPGCTIEACGFRDNFAAFTKKNAVILGVSGDTEAKHTKFIEKFSLPFSLLADTEKKTAEDYGVWKEKSMYGKKYMGIERTTFLIDPNGNIAKIYEKVKPQGHESEILSDIESMS